MHKTWHILQVSEKARPLPSRIKNSSLAISLSDPDLWEKRCLHCENESKVDYILQHMHTKIHLFFKAQIKLAISQTWPASIDFYPSKYVHFFQGLILSFETTSNIKLHFKFNKK